MKKSDYNTYGQQLMLDGYNADTKKCADVKGLYDLLMVLPEKIGMRRVGFPHIIQITEKGIMGLSGFVFIMESHISIHTYEERGFVTADIYSCKSFDEKTACKLLVDSFGIKSFESEVTLRGRHFAESTPSPMNQNNVPTRRR